MRAGLGFVEARQRADIRMLLEGFEVDFESASRRTLSQQLPEYQPFSEHETQTIGKLDRDRLAGFWGIQKGLESDGYPLRQNHQLDGSWAPSHRSLRNMETQPHGTIAIESTFSGPNSP